MILTNDPKVIELLNKYGVCYAVTNHTIEIDLDDQRIIFKQNNVEDIEMLIEHDYWKQYWVALFTFSNLNTIQHFYYLWSKFDELCIFVFLAITLGREDDNPELFDYVWNYSGLKKDNIEPEFHLVPNENVKILDYLIKNNLISDLELVLTIYLQDNKFILVDYLIRNHLIPKDKLNQIFNNHFSENKNMEPELIKVVLELHNEGFIQPEEKYLVGHFLDSCCMNLILIVDIYLKHYHVSESLIMEALGISTNDIKEKLIIFSIDKSIKIDTNI
jgi:hypothetical protein